MLDRYAIPLIRPPLTATARLLVRAGLGANAVTLLGFGLGLIAAILIASGAYSMGALAILASRLCDGLDGAVARQTQATDAGGFLDITLDFLFYASIPLAFALADPTRNALAAAVLLLCLAVSFAPRFWRGGLALAWLGAIGLGILLMGGGVAGLDPVPMEKWSGLPVTLLLASLAVVGGFTLAILLAFARQSPKRRARWPSVIFIEVVRGTPLIGVLFLAAIMFPLFVPSWLTIDSLPRVQLALILFTAAYMAEVIRGGLLAVPAGQVEAARALGLTKWQARRHVVLPQAIKVSVPGLVNTSISEVKNTTLVLIVGVFDLLQTTRLSYLEAEWRPYFAEAYLFTAMIFFWLCFSLSRLSLKIERKLNYAG